MSIIPHELRNGGRSSVARHRASALFGGDGPAIQPLLKHYWRINLPPTVGYYSSMVQPLLAITHLLFNHSSYY